MTLVALNKATKLSIKSKSTNHLKIEIRKALSLNAELPKLGNRNCLSQQHVLNPLAHQGSIQQHLKMPQISLKWCLWTLVYFLTYFSRPGKAEFHF